MIAVVNATPLIALSLLDRLDLLHYLFDRVLTPLAVYQEVAARGHDRPGASALAGASWIEVRDPPGAPTIIAWLADQITRP